MITQLKEDIFIINKTWKELHASVALKTAFPWFQAFRSQAVYVNREQYTVYTTYYYYIVYYIYILYCNMKTNWSVTNPLTELIESEVHPHRIFIRCLCTSALSKKHVDKSETRCIFHHLLQQRRSRLTRLSAMAQLFTPLAPVQQTMGGSPGFASWFWRVRRYQEIFSWEDGTKKPWNRKEQLGSAQRLLRRWEDKKTIHGNNREHGKWNDWKRMSGMKCKSVKLILWGS